MTDRPNITTDEPAVAEETQEQTALRLSREAAQMTLRVRGEAAQKTLRVRREAALAQIDDDSSGIFFENAWRKFSDKAARDYYLESCERAGLAFSGGGIRSATIALGLTEALASRGRLYAFDLMSTVSGGGYFGSFLRALHISRGSCNEEKSIVADRLKFAQATMTSQPDLQYFRGDPGPSRFINKNKTVKNPLWWLRENGRYLAPSGMTDYGFALAYIIRNWVSLIIFLVGVALAFFGALQVMLVGLVNFGFNWDSSILSSLAGKNLHTPLIPVFVIFCWIGVGIGGAYWFSTPLTYSRKAGKEQRWAGWSKSVWVGCFVVLVLLSFLMDDVFSWVPRDATARNWAFGLKIALGAALLSAAFTVFKTRKNGHVDFRREQTRLLFNFSALLIFLAGLTAIDWAALSLRLWMSEAGLKSDGREVAITGLFTGTIASAVSFLIAKLPQWFSAKETGFGKFLVSNARYFALVAAIVILASIGLLADVLAIKLLWKKQAWVYANIEWPVFGLVVGIVSFVAILFASSPGFANLLALTPLYGSRLTRAFVGGSNVHRLDSSFQSEVTQGHKDDDIQLPEYMEAESAAPLHFINATRNRTIGEAIQHAQIDIQHDDPMVLESADHPRGRLASYESSLTLHDRHGDRMVFGPFGLRVGAEFYDWSELKDPPSLGLLCAISGSAVGAGMGRLTSLGAAMALTLANIRLGYWWTEQVRVGEMPRGTALSKLLPGLSCLGRELMGRFGTRGQWFLSDGGHTENTGVLTLLERGCRFILATDNGQDADFVFGDLELLIRTARTDIGMEVATVKHDAFPANLEPVRVNFLNGAEGDWRARARDKDNSCFALLLKASDIPERVNGVWKRRRGGDGWIVWLKPKCFSDMPADLATYAAVHPDFPQQSTGNQFFDEAQWESYRRLGFEMGRRLFAKRETFKRFLPVIHPMS